MTENRLEKPPDPVQNELLKDAQNLVDAPGSHTPRSSDTFDMLSGWFDPENAVDIYGPAETRQPDNSMDVVDIYDLLVVIDDPESPEKTDKLNAAVRSQPSESMDSFEVIDDPSFVPGELICDLNASTYLPKIDFCPPVPFTPPTTESSLQERLEDTNVGVADRSHKYKILTSDDSQPEPTLERFDERSESAKISPNILLVKGIRKSTSTDTVECFFENKRRSGGGEVKSVKHNTTTGEATITFVNSEDAANVIEKSNLRLEDTPLTVSWWMDKTEIEPSPDKSKKENSTIIVNDRLEENSGLIENNEDSSNIVQTRKLLFENQPLVANSVGPCTSGIASSEEVKHTVSRSLMVRGLNPKTPLDVIQMFFENKKRSGGGPIEHIQHDANRGTAFITFETADAIKSVMQKKALTLDDFTLDIEVTDIKPEKINSSVADDETGPIAAIEVSWLAESTTYLDGEILGPFFQNKAHSGGGDIKSINLDKDNGLAVITYVNCEVANEVLRKEKSKPFQLIGVPLKVKGLEIEVPAISCAIEVNGFSKNTTEEILIMFFENKRRSGGNYIEAIHLDVANRRAVITYPTIEDTQSVLLKQPFILDGCTLNIKMLQPAIPAAQVHGPVDKNKLFVSLMEEDTLADNLVLFLECRSKCKVKQVYFGRKKGQALVEFDGIPDYCGVRELICLKPLRGRMLRVQQVPLPDTIQVHNVSGIKTVILQLYFENERSGGGPTEQIHYFEEEDCATIQFSDRTVLKKVLSRKHILNNTELNVSVFHECLGILPLGNDLSQAHSRYSKTTVTTPSHIWKEFLKRVGDVRMYEEDNVKIQINGLTSSVEICGLELAVSKVAHHMSNIKRKLEEELVIKQVTLQEHQLKILREIHFDQKEKEIDITITNKEIILNGLPHVMKAAQLHMFKILNSILFEIIPDVPGSVCRLLTKTPIHDHIVDHFKKCNICFTWDATKEGLMVYALNDDDLKKGTKFIQSEIIERKIDLTDGCSVLQTENWKQLRDTLLDRYPDILAINVNDDDGHVYVTSLKQKCDIVVAEITSFISDNKILDKTIVLDSVKYKFIKKVLMSEIQMIVTDLKNMLVEVTFEEEGNQTHMIIKGNKFGIAPGERRVKDLIKEIVFRERNIEEPGMNSFFVSKRGQDFIRTTEMRYTVAIEVVTDGNNGTGMTTGSKNELPIDPTSVKAICKAKLKNGTQVFITKGDLTTYIVGAIVKFTTNDLILGGRLPYAIFKKGGDSIRDECKAHARTSDKLLPGHVFTSGAGKLPCKKIHHAVGPTWLGGEQGEENLIYLAIYECLSATVKNGLDSVAIPALRTDFFGVPIMISTRTIVGAIKDFCEQEAEGTRLTKVYLVDTQDTFVDQFSKCLQSALGATLEPAKPLYTQVDDNSLVTSKGVKVTLCIGGIEEQTVDVIVNTTSKDIEPNGGVSGAIFKAAGPNLKAETKILAPLNPGSIAVTNGHNLQCKSIYHASCRAWDGPNGKCVTYIKQIVAASLKTAAQSGYNSIAFPAIGTGINNVPRDTCAKILYQEVAIHSNTSVREVRFVIYDKDMASIKAFEAEMRSHFRPPKAGTEQSRFLKQSSTNFTARMPKDTAKSVEPDGAAGNGAVNTSGLQVTLGPVELQLELADITKESTGVIVNSTNVSIDLTIGGVARALAKAGGLQFVQECKKTAMVDNVAITTGGNLKADRVIHIVAPTDLKQWKKVIMKSMQEAERLGYRSLSFPALGTGQLKISGSLMCNVMLDTIAEFAESKPKSLHLVRIVIFPEQPHVLDTFRSEITHKATIGRKLSWWKSAKGAISGILRGRHSQHGMQPLGGGSEFPSIKVLPPPRAVTVIGNDECKEDKAVDISSDKRDIAQYHWCYEEDGALEPYPDDINSRIEEAFNSKKLEVEWAEQSGETFKIDFKAMVEITNNAAGARVKVQRKIIPEFFDLSNPSPGRQPYEPEVLPSIEVFEPPKTITTLRMCARKLTDIHSAMKDMHAVCNVDYKESVTDKSMDQGQWYFPEDGGLEYHDDINSKGLVQTEVKSRKPHGLNVVLPPNWAPVDPSMHVQLIALPSTHSEYQQVEGKLRDSAAPASINRIISIERVQNTSLFQRYALHKEKMMKANPKGDVENILWYGTSVEDVDSVNIFGFNGKYDGHSARAFGNGMYFAKNASYSCAKNHTPPDPATGHRHIYLFKVLTGDYAQGTVGMILPPVKSGTVLYDSLVDNVARPSIFVIFNDTQAYPEYHVTFS